MRVTQQYRTHHSQLLDLMEMIEERLNAAEIGTDPAPARRLFTQLAGKLMFHLAVEDGAFYPRLLSHPDREVRQLASQYAAEMGHLRGRFEDFMRQWVHSDLIRRDPEMFVEEAGTMFRALRSRIDKEDHGLYELVDRIEGRATAQLLGIAV